MKITKPVGPEWTAIEQSIYDNFAAEGIELVLPVIPWDSDDDDTNINNDNNITTAIGDTDVNELMSLYKNDIEILKTVCAHNHTTRNIYTNDTLRSHLHSEKPINPKSHSIDIIDAEITSLSTFIKNHVDITCNNKNGLPCLIKNIPNVGKWRAVERWSSIESLMKYYGKMPIKIGEVPPIHGMGRPYQVRLPFVLFKDYTEKNIADSPFYAFEYDFQDSRASLLEDYNIPDYFKNDIYDLDSITRAFYPNNRHLIIGGERTGTNLHFDPKGTSAWNTLLIGRKKWAFFPPGTDIDYIKAIGTRTCQSGTAPGGPVAYWWLDIAPDVAEQYGMIECVQHAGDTIFIPGGWWHCVINLEFTMAITQNLLIPESLKHIWPQFKKDWPKFSQYMEVKYYDKLKQLGVENIHRSSDESQFSLDDEEVMMEFHRTQMQ